MKIHEQWTEAEVIEAATQVWDKFYGECKSDFETFLSDVAATRKGWSMGSHVAYAIEITCQRNALRNSLTSAVADIWEHSREYHHITKPEFFEKANAALEKSK